MPVTRFFIALILPHEVKKRIQGIQKELAPLFPPQTHWINAENLHLTLAFLGDRRLEEIATISQILQDLAPKTSPLVLKPHYLKSFGSVLGIKMLSKKSQKLHQNLVNAFRKAKIIYHESHKFTPHITIARLKTRPLKKVKKNIRFPAFKLEEITLIKSTLFSKGAKYDVVHHYSCKRTIRQS
ncbi:MAG: RNA 2',3'-cyclic phosphodiesterase [Patescibacteria group bacterium]|nr:RNA 2',3'-cyclic phosphodiesterase [Patescibacteria group bacterium]